MLCKCCCHTVNQRQMTFWERCHPSVWRFSAVIQDSTQSIGWIHSACWGRSLEKRRLQPIVLVAFQFSVSGLARPARRCDVCLLRLDTVQISVDPSPSNKHMSLGTEDKFCSHWTLGYPCLWLGKISGLVGNGGGKPLPLLVKQDHLKALWAGL